MPKLGWGQTRNDYTAGAQAPGATNIVILPTITKNGFMGGLFAGYNYQIDQFVVGAEADGNFLIVISYVGKVQGCCLCADANGEAAIGARDDGGLCAFCAVAPSRTA